MIPITSEAQTPGSVFVQLQNHPRTYELLRMLHRPCKHDLKFGLILMNPISPPEGAIEDRFFSILSSAQWSQQ